MTKTDTKRPVRHAITLAATCHYGPCSEYTMYHRSPVKDANLHKERDAVMADTLRRCDANTYGWAKGHRWRKWENTFAELP